jgi:hypothetical protein
MIRLFHKLDKYLLTHHPLLWSIQLHRLFIWWLPSFLILVGLFLFQDIENRSDATDGLILTWLWLMTIGLLILWLIYLFRFNVMKQFGRRPMFDEVQNFFYVFIGFAAISMIPRTVEVARIVKINTLYPKEKIVNVLCAYDKVRLDQASEYSTMTRVCRSTFSSQKEYQDSIDAMTKRALNVNEVDGCFEFQFQTIPQAAYENYYYSEILNELDISADSLLMAYSKVKRTKNTQPLYEDLANACKVLTDFPYSGAEIKDNFQDFNFRFLNLGYDYYPNTQPSSKEAMYGRKVSNIANAAVKYAYRESANFWNELYTRIMFYMVFFATLFLLIFRNMTLKTFLVSLGVGALMPLVVVILMFISGSWDNDRVFPVLLFLYVVFLLGSLCIWAARKRNIFMGIALNFLTLTTPMLGIFFVGWYFERRSNVIGLEEAMRQAEWIQILVFLVLLQPFFKNLYVRWYSLPEQ